MYHAYNIVWQTNEIDCPQQLILMHKVYIPDLIVSKCSNILIPEESIATIIEVCRQLNLYRAENRHHYTGRKAKGKLKDAHAVTYIV